MLTLNENCQSFAYCDHEETIYFTKNNKIYKKISNSEEVETQITIPIWSEENIQKNINHQNLFHSIKFSQNLSGKNVIIQGGGTIATIGNSSKEDIAVVSGICPKGTVLIDIHCPLSCANLSFGMVSLINGSLNPQTDIKNFRSFRNTTQRTITMEINYEKRILRFFLDGNLKKEKTIEFNNECVFPAVYILSPQTSVILNSFAKVGNLDYPLYFSKNRNEKDSQYLFNKFCFVTDLPKSSIESNFDKDKFIKSQFVLSNSENKEIKIIDSFLPIDSSTNTLKGVLALVFENNKDIHEFKVLNKDVKIGNQQIKFLEKNQVQEILSKSLFNEINLEKLLNKKNNSLKVESSTADFTFLEINKQEEVSRLLPDPNQRLVAEWIIENYELFYFDSSLNLNIVNLIKEIETKKELFNKFIDKFEITEKETTKVPSNDNNVSLQYIKSIDKILIIRGPFLKLLSRDINGNFNFNDVGRNQLINSMNSIEFIYDIYELKCLIEILNWKDLVISNSDSNSFRAIYYFFNSLDKLIKINDNQVIINLRPKQSKKFVELLISHLNKLLFCTKQYDRLVDNLKKKSVNFDKEIDKSLPFAPEYEEEVQNEEDKTVLNKYTIESFDKLLSAYRGLIFLEEQIGLLNFESEPKKSSIAPQSVRFASALSRLSTFINYPNTKMIIELANKGFYVSNTLTHELKYFSRESTKLVDFELAEDAESLDNLLTSQIPNNLINESNLSSNIPLNRSLNLIAPSVHCNNKTKEISNINNYTVHSNLPFVGTCSDNGVFTLWNTQVTLFKAASINFKTALKEITDFKEIKEIKWLKDETEYKNINDIFVLENFEVPKEESILNPLFSPKPEKILEKITPSQEYVNNLYIMGFSLEASKLALIEKKNNFDQALEFLCEKSSDPEFQKQFAKREEVADEKVNPWECVECTFLNEKGEYNCEICGANIPENILKEYIQNQQKKKDEKEKLEKEKILSQLNLNESKAIEVQIEKFEFLKDCRILNTHIVFNNNDPLAPLIVIAILQDLITNKIYVNSIKLMINPLIIKDFTKIAKDGFFSNLTGRKFKRIDDCVSHLNQSHFINMHTLYPLFVGRVNEENFNSYIPIEQDITEIKSISYFDSIILNENINSSRLLILVEEDEKVYKIIEFSLNNQFKFNNISVKSIDPLQKSFLVDFKDDYPSELKLFKDNHGIYILSKDFLKRLSSDFETISSESNFVGNVGNFNQLYLKRDKNNLIREIFISDDNQKLYSRILNVTTLDESNKETDVISQNNYEESKLAQLNIDDLTYSELSSLSQLLDLERIGFRTNNAGNSIIINDSKSMIAKKSYFDFSTKIKKPIQNSVSIEVDLTKENLVSNLNFELLFTSKQEKESLLKKKEFQKDSNSKFNSIVLSTNEEISNLSSTNSLPLKVVDFTGSQSSKSVNVSSVIYGVSFFSSNYSKPDYIFSHIHDKLLYVESVIVGSGLQNKAGESPLGEGLIFLLNSLDHVQTIRNYTDNWKTIDFENFIKDKELKGEEFYEFDPVGYVSMGKSELVRTKIIAPRTCKYIFFKPTNMRTQPKDFSNQWESPACGVIFSSFSAEGSVSASQYHSDNSNYVKITEKRLNYFKTNGNTEIVLRVLGYNGKSWVKLNEDKEIRINKSYSISYIKYNNEFINLFGSYISLNNELNKNDKFTSLKIELDGLLKNQKIELQGFSFDVKAFKSLTSKNEQEFKNLQSIPINSFRSIIIEKDKFDIFNKKFVNYLCSDSKNNEKKARCLRFLKYLSERIPTLKASITESINLKLFLKYNVLENPNNNLINLSIDFLRLLSNEENIKSIRDEFIDIFNNLHLYKVTTLGFKSFYSFISNLNIEANVLTESLIKNIKFSLENIKSSKLQNDYYVYLKNYLKLDVSPFDSNLFFLGKNDGTTQEYENSRKGNLINSNIISEVLNGTMKITIDLESIYNVNELNLEFLQNITNEDYNFRVCVWASNPNSTIEENFDLILTKTYPEHIWKLLTKYQKENVLLKGKDKRNLQLNNLNFLTRYLIIEICVNVGNFSQNLEFPKLFIIPEIYGEKVHKDEYYEYNKIKEYFISNISQSTSQLNLNDKVYNLKSYQDPKIYSVNLSENHEANEFVQKKNVSNEFEVDISTIKNNLKTFQFSLEKIISDLIQKRDGSDEISKGKIKTIIEDIRNNQIKINTIESNIDLLTSLSANIYYLSTFIKSICLISTKNSASLKLALSNTFKESSELVDFIILLFEICIFNENGHITVEAINFIKNYLWENLDKDSTSSFFNQIIIKHLMKDSLIRSPIKIIESLSYVDIDIDSILTKLKESFNQNYEDEQIPDAFYNISSLIMILIKKIKNNANQIAEKCKDIILINIEFLRYLTTSSRFSKEINDIILLHTLNLLNESFKTITSDVLNQIISPELIEFMVNNLFDLWDNTEIRIKISNIVEKLIDPFSILEFAKSKKKVKISLKDNIIFSAKSLSDKTTLNSQKLTLKYLDNLFQVQSKIEEINKLDYILNILNNSYSINSCLSMQIKEFFDINLQDEISLSPEIKDKNSQIIDKFINVMINVNSGYKIGFSSSHNFWKYLSDILERGNLEMIFHNNIFSTLILKSFFNFDISLQEFFLQKFINVFKILYNKETKKSLEIFDEIARVIIEIIKQKSNTNSELIAIKFLIQLVDILLTNSTPLVEESLVNSQFSCSKSIQRLLFIETSNYLLQYINIASFTGVISSSNLIFSRIKLARNLLQLVNTYIITFLKDNEDLSQSQEFRFAISNYLTWMIFNYYSEDGSQIPVVSKVAKCYTLIKEFINLCSKKRNLIEILLSEFMKIIRKIDDQIFRSIKNTKMSQKKGKIVTEKLLSTLEFLIDLCLCDEEVTKYFAFELEGFKFFIDRVNSHRQNIVTGKSVTSVSKKVENSKTFKLNSDLLQGLMTDGTKSEEPGNNKVEDSNLIINNLAEINYEEFAIVNKFSLLEGDPSQPTATITNLNWSTKKKPATGHIYTRDMKDNGYFTESFVFSLPNVVEVKDVFIGFSFNVTSVSDKTSGMIETVYLEAGETLDKMDISVKLTRIEDISYLDKCVVSFGFNFFSYKPDHVKLDQDYLDNVLDQLVYCKAKFFKFTVFRPPVLCNEYSFNNQNKLINDSSIIGLNHVSIYGLKLVNNQKVLEYIQEKEKEVSIKIISKIFTTEFIDTLKFIAQDSTIINNIKQIYDAFEPYINQHASILSNILINVSKYNFELGEWLLNRLLSIDNSEIHAKLAIEISQNNEEFVNLRLNKFLNFIIQELNPTAPIFFASDVEKKLKNIGKFCYYFSIILNGLLTSPYQAKKIELNIDFDGFLKIIKNLQKYSIIFPEIEKLICILLIPNKKLLLNKFLDPEEAIILLHEMYVSTYISDYSEIISCLIASSDQYAKISFKRGVFLYYLDDFLGKIASGIRGKNILYLMGNLKNMSYSKLFVKQVRENDYDFKIFDSIKDKDEKSETILLNNNGTFLNNFVIFIRNCIIDYPECHKRLATILINDLEICKKKIDKNYANNVLMPLLRMEKTTNLCLHPIDSFLKSVQSMYCNLSSSGSNSNQEKVEIKEEDMFSSSSILNNNPQKEILKKFIKNLKFDEKKFPFKTFKSVFNSKSVDKNNFYGSVSQALSGISNFLILTTGGGKKNINKTKLDENEIITGFFTTSALPTLPGSLVGTDYQTLYIPYTNNNFLFQIQGSNHIIYKVKPDYEENTGKEYELGNIYFDSYSANLSITGDIIYLSLMDPSSSNVNPYPEVCQLLENKGLTDLKYTTVKDFEIFVAMKEDNNDIQSSSEKKILSTKYIDETGNLSQNVVKNMKYYKDNHPLLSVRNNPILEIPINVNIKILKDFFIHENIEMKLLFTNETLKNETSLALVEDHITNINIIESNNIIDVSYDVSSIRGIIGRAEIAQVQIPNYEPILPVFKSFENLDGIRKIVGVLKNSILMWKTKDVMAKWVKWIDEVESFSEFPSFFSTLIRHQKCFDIIFNLLCGIYDTENSYKELGLDASKYIYEILNTSFVANNSMELREAAIEKGIFKNVLERLQLLTREKPRRLNQDNVTEEKSKNEKEKTDNKDKKKENKNLKKGIGYGSDQTGDNKSWDVNNYLENKKNTSEQIHLIVRLIANFFNTPNLELKEEYMNLILESCLLPVLESAFRSVSLLELAKEDFLYFSYLELVQRLSENKNLICLLLDLPPEYKPQQTDSVFKLMGQLNEVSKIFSSCVKGSKSKEKAPEEKLASEIERVYKIVDENVKYFKTVRETDKNYSEILKQDVSISYPSLLRELAFDYMSMKDPNGKYVHFYSANISDNPSSAKLIRLAQEYANLSRALPIEHTNGIFVRVDKDQMDLVKVLIMGSVGTPYAHGAFEYDVLFDSNYPQGPPKVSLITTGSQQVRFNPNLYANGKVCLSLLGTWKGQSTENWDPKISTLLQVLLSIQSIIMSEYVYFNEPSCEGEIGKPEGEAKNEAYSNIVRYANIKFAMIEQIRKPSKGFEEVIKRHFYLKKAMILEETKSWIERSKTAVAKYASFSYDHNQSWAQKFSVQETYTKMMEEIYVELEKELNNLPIPSDLKKKCEESEQTALKQKKNDNLIDNFQNLGNVDLEYDDKVVDIKEIDVNDEKVQDRWSRYIGAMGIEAVAKQANSSVFLSGASGLGIEIAKNIVLSGCKRFVLHDTKKTKFTDLSSQFFLTEEDIGLNRAERSIKKLQELNYYVKIFSSTSIIPKEDSQLDKFGMKDFNVVILTQCDYETMIAVDKYCRKRNIHFISCDLYGVFGRVINDFGDKFLVVDQNGEDLKENILKSITNEKEGIVTVMEGTRHDFQDGDEIVFLEVEGMKEYEDKDSMIQEKLSESKSINGTKHKITVINPYSFKISGDTTIYSPYIRNGKVRQIKTNKLIKFNELEFCLNNKEIPLDPNLAIADFTKISFSLPNHIAFEALDVFSKINKNLPGVWDIKSSKEFLEIATKISAKFEYELSESDIKILTLFSFTSQTQFSPLAAFLGGIVAQEAIKAMTAKFTPISQVFYYSTHEVLPEIEIKDLENSVKKAEIALGNKRTDGLQMIVGSEIMKQINQMKILMVGAGAIGCELLKNFAMLEVGTFEGKEQSENGCIYVTDPDIIEISNLNRQFLFREKHLRKSKSVTASAAAIQMNKNLKNHVKAYLEKICEQTEHIFNDKFIGNLSLIANALDNVNARRYVDLRCVSNRIHLLESGTLGPKGHVQVISPFKTESYSSQNDPEVSSDIPQCTLKMFPEEALHCLEWARDRFGKLFTQRPKNVNLVLEEGQENQELKVMIQVLKTLKNSPNSFDDCLKIAREKFEKFFSNSIKQLLFAYPIDKLNKDGSKFWSLPKRPPVHLEFDPNDQMHANFIAAFACLTAKIFKIKIPFENPRINESKINMSKSAFGFKVPEFKPNELKAKEMEKEIENQNKKAKDNEEQEEKKIEDEFTKPLMSLDTVLSEFDTIKEKLNLSNFKKLKELEKKEKLLTVEEFEKDNDSNFHIDLIHAMSNLRCRNYKLDEMDWINVKIKAGRIIPALATTTAAIAGLQSLELVKIAKKMEIDNLKNSFLNLAIPYFQASEPGLVSNIELKEGLKVNLWDRWDVEINLKDEKANKLSYLFDHLKEKYGLLPKDCFKGKSGIYMSAMYENNNEEKSKILSSNLQKILKIDDEEYCDLTITFALLDKPDEILKSTPKVRLIFRKD